MASRAPFTLRPTTPDDREALVEVYLETRAAWLLAIELPAAQRDVLLAQQYGGYLRHLETLPGVSDEVVEVAGAVAGRLVVGRSASEMRLVDIGLLAAHRGRGLGRALLDGLIAESEATGTVITLAVEPTSPALRLYERAGFRSARADDTARRADSLGTESHLQLERQPATPRA